MDAWGEVDASTYDTSFSRDDIVLADGYRIKRFCAPIRPNDVPTDEQVRAVLQAIADAHELRKAVVVHCERGKGRTGTICACWCLKKRHDLTAKNAIALIRGRDLAQSPTRRGSIETEEQEQYIEKFERLLKDHVYADFDSKFGFRWIEFERMACMTVQPDEAALTTLKTRRINCYVHLDAETPAFADNLGAHNITLVQVPFAEHPTKEEADDFIAQTQRKSIVVCDSQGGHRAKTLIAYQLISEYMSKIDYNFDKASDATFGKLNLVLPGVINTEQQAFLNVLRPRRDMQVVGVAERAKRDFRLDSVPSLFGGQGFHLAPVDQAARQEASAAPHSLESGGFGRNPFGGFSEDAPMGEKPSPVAPSDSVRGGGFNPFGEVGASQ
jgi:hypothetical protein